MNLLVGESLLPAAIPILRALDLEERVAAMAHIKLGAGFRHADGTRIDFRFPHYRHHRPGYAYNVPRPEFDRLLLERAKELGVQVIMAPAQLEQGADNQADLQLTDRTLAAAGLTRDSQPDWLVDASGRSRLFSRTLSLPSVKGCRNDLAMFAHFKQFDAESAFDGQVLLTADTFGWFWQIPLPDRLSVGVVLDKSTAAAFGSTAQARLNRAIDENPLLRQAGKNRQQLTSVASYSRYQLISRQAYGGNWVLAGDAFGFVDPMLSPGVFMAMESARLLDQLVFSEPDVRTRDLDRYQAAMEAWHQPWQSIIGLFYSGELLTMASIRQQLLATQSVINPTRLLEKIVSQSLAGLTTGFKTRSSLHFNIVKHSCQHMCKNHDTVQSRAILSNLT